MKKMNFLGVDRMRSERGNKLNRVYHLAIGLFLLLFTSNFAFAQLPSFVDSETAIDLLKNEILTIENQMPGLSGAQLETAQYTVIYFADVVGQIQDQVSVADAIFQGYSLSLGSMQALSDLASSDEYYSFLSTPRVNRSDRLASAYKHPKGSQTPVNPYIDSAISLLKL